MALTQMKQPFDVQEGETLLIAGQFQDETGTPVPNTLFTSMNLWLYDVDTGVIINNRENQDILGAGTGANNVTIDGLGNFEWTMQPEDNPILGGAPIECHEAMIKWVFDPGSGDRTFYEIIQVGVKNLLKVT